MNKIPNLKILIVEDDAVSEIVISRAVKAISSETVNVRSGMDAIEACRKNTDFDLILMDIQLPIMDGYEATRQIRQFNKSVIIIAQTAYALTGDKERAIEAGCTDYVSKPINKDLLLSIIKKHFEIQPDIVV
jgi:CheY-like chemotaxis protein